MWPPQILIIILILITDVPVPPPFVAGPSPLVGILLHPKRRRNVDGVCFVGAVNEELFRNFSS